MGIKKISLNIIFAVFLVQTISALTIDIQILDSFSQGEQIYFNYDITSDKMQEITFISRVSCSNAPVSLIQEERISLVANIPYNGIYEDIIVDENIEPQTCTAYIQILSSIQQTFSKNFSIITDPSFSFEIKLDKKVFLKSQDIYLNYTSSIDNPSLTSTLTYPDQTTEQITLPTTIKASQIGTYELETTASKEGYKTISVKKQFGVIEKQTDIKTIETPDLEEFKADGISDKYLEDKGTLIFWGLIIVIFVILYVLFKKNKLNLQKLVGVKQE